MKVNLTKHILSVCLTGLCLSACNTESNYPDPSLDCADFDVPTLTFQDLQDMCSAGTVLIDRAAQWKGIVVSSDRDSNLFGALYLQDKADEPEGGVVFYTDLLETHAVFPLGSRVTVFLEGLYLGNADGSCELGGAFPIFGSISVGRLPASLTEKHLKVSCEELIQPTARTLGIEALSDRMLSTLVRVEGVEFVDQELGMPFAETGQQTMRTLVDCQGNTLPVQNSGYSDFHLETLPFGNGSASGILSSHGGDYALLLRSAGDLQLENPRCEVQFPKRTSDRILISEIADPDNIPEARFLELYNASDTVFDLRGWEVRRYTNDNLEPGMAVPLDGIEIAPGEAVVLSAYGDVFETTYGVPPDLIVPRNGPADSNGDDSVELVDPFGTVVDAFGIPGIDGTGTPHEFEDGRALRLKEVDRSKPVFDPGQWMVFNDSGGNGTVKQPKFAPADFTPGTH